MVLTEQLGQAAIVRRLRARMIVPAITSVLGVVAIWPASAQQAYRVIGIGDMSCAYWRSDPRREIEGVAYAYGLWTGLNMVNPKNRYVGASTDPEGIIGEIKKACASSPSSAFVDVIADVYVSLGRKELAK